MKKERYIIPETAVIHTATESSLLTTASDVFETDAKRNPFDEAPADKNSANTEEDDDNFTWGNLWAKDLWE